MATNQYPQYPKKNNSILFVIIALVVVGVAMVGCAHSKTDSEVRKEKIETGARPVVIDDEVNLMTRVNFEQGSARLTEASKKQISRALAKAETIGDVDGVKVMSWSDREYPAADQKTLTKAQQDLALERNRSIRDFIAVIDGDNDIDVDTYNMARRPSAVAEFFNTTDAKVKHTVDKSRQPTETAAKKASRASSALVIFNLGDSVDAKDGKYEAGL